MSIVLMKILMKLEFHLYQLDFRFCKNQVHFLKNKFHWWKIELHFLKIHFHIWKIDFELRKHDFHIWKTKFRIWKIEVPIWKTEFHIWKWIFTFGNLIFVCGKSKWKRYSMQTGWMVFNCECPGSWGNSRFLMKMQEDVIYLNSILTSSRKRLVKHFLSSQSTQARCVFF